ncbi:MAG: SDR family NAD(P)-dependent oxidoreductase [Bacteroidales bacterium]
MNILVTGASRGLGYETALQLAAGTGHHVLAIARSKDRLEALCRTCREKDPSARITPLPLDLLHVTSEPGEVVRKITKVFSQVDVLIHNAGSMLNRPFEETGYEEILRLFQVNFFVPALLTKALLPLMKNTHVLSIGSMGGFQGSVKFPGLGYYSAGKGALAVWTECMAEEFKDRGLRFNMLALGSVQTEMLQEAFPGYEAPLSAGEMAAFVADFALNGHRFFNGKILPVSVTTP